MSFMVWKKCKKSYEKLEKIKKQPNSEIHGMAKKLEKQMWKKLQKKTSEF